MQHFIHLTALVFSFTFILSSMIGAGLGLTISELTAPLKRKGLVWRALIINFVLVPIAALIICETFKLIPCMRAGLMIMALAGGAPFLPKMVTLAKGNVVHSITLMVLLMAVTVGFLPAFLPLTVPNTTIFPLKVALPQIFLLLLPLVIGLLANTLFPRFAAATKPFIIKTAAFSLIITGALSLWRDYYIFTAAWGTGMYTFLTLLFGGALLIGYLWGGPDQGDKIVMSLGAGARNIPAALLVAVTNFPDHRVAAVVIIGSLVEFVLLLLFAKLYGRKRNGSSIAV